MWTVELTVNWLANRERLMWTLAFWGMTLKVNI